MNISPNELSGPKIKVSELELIQQIYGQIFAIARPVPPDQRSSLFSCLLGSFNLIPICGSRKECDKYLKERIGDEGYTQLQDLLYKGEVQRLTDSLSQEIGISYAVASYWSPTDRRRRTTAMRKKLNEEQTSKADLAALLFFALTFQVSNIESRRTSIVQFLSTEAERKRGISTRFLGKTSNTSSESGGQSSWLSISEDFSDQLLSQLKVDETLKDLNKKYTTDEIRAELKALLHEETRPENSIGNRAILPILESLDGFTDFSEHQQILDAKSALSSSFGNEINISQTVYMVMTQALWQRACPCDFMYTFPVPTYASHACCVLTVGTSNTTEQQSNHPCFEAASVPHLALSLVARSLFTDPLLIDYANLGQRLVVADLAHEQAHILRPISNALNMITDGKPVVGNDGSVVSITVPSDRLDTPARWESAKQEFVTAHRYLRFLNGAYGSLSPYDDLFGKGKDNLKLREALQEFINIGTSIGARRACRRHEFIEERHVCSLNRSLVDAVMSGFDGEITPEQPFWNLDSSEQPKRFGVCAVFLCLLINTAQHLKNSIEFAEKENLESPSPLLTFRLCRETLRIENWDPSGPKQQKAIAGLDGKSHGTKAVLLALLTDDRFGWKRPGKVRQFGRRTKTDFFVIDVNLPGNFWKFLEE